MALSHQDVRDLALLARLEITDNEVDLFTPQLESILGFIAKLSELDTQNVDPMTTALDVDNRWRSDAIKPGLDRDSALRNAPAADDECFRVPPVLAK